MIVDSTIISVSIRQMPFLLPTVAWCASELAYSARYFGDMIHQATGGTAIGYIHSFVIFWDR